MLPSCLTAMMPWCHDVLLLFCHDTRLSSFPDAMLICYHSTRLPCFHFTMLPCYQATMLPCSHVTMPLCTCTVLNGPVRSQKVLICFSPFEIISSILNTKFATYFKNKQKQFYGKSIGDPVENPCPSLGFGS